MKKVKFIHVVYLLCICCLSLGLLGSCKYDDSDLVERMDNLEGRLAKLEEQCKQINANINSLQIIVNALKEANHITSISNLVENGVEIGYKIEFAKRDPIHIYHGKAGADGARGEDGYTPLIGVKKDKDGIYYWTLDGNWLTDNDGNKVRAQGLDGKDGYNGKDGKDGEDGKDGKDGKDGYNGSDGKDGKDGYNGKDGKDGYNGKDGKDGYNGKNGVTPKLRIKDGNWEVSYNNGVSWETLGSATGGVVPCPIKSVEVKGRYVLFTLNSGDEIKIPLYNAITIKFEETTIGMGASSQIDLLYTLTGGDNVKVSAIGEGVRTSVDESAKKLTITTDVNFTGGKVLVHATDGNNVATVELTIVKEVLVYIEYGATEELSYDGAFSGIDVEFIKEKSTFSDSDKKGKWAFKGSIKGVVSSAFNGKKSLLSIILPEGITFIGNSAFLNSGLEAITLPESLMEIGQSVFLGTQLKEITIPANVESLGSSAFESSDAGTMPLEKVIFNGSKIKEIEPYTFKNCVNLKEITLPESLMIIDYDAFFGCSSLTKVVIPDNVVEIGKKAFLGCTSLTEATIGRIVISIGEKCFDGCEKLATVICKGESPARLGVGAFMKDEERSGTKYIKSIKVPTTAVSIYKNAAGWKDFSDRISGY